MTTNFIQYYLYSGLKFSGDLLHKYISTTLDIKNILILKALDTLFEELPTRPQ